MTHTSEAKVNVWDELAKRPGWNRHEAKVQTYRTIVGGDPDQDLWETYCDTLKDYPSILHNLIRDAENPTPRPYVPHPDRSSAY